MRASIWIVFVITLCAGCVITTTAYDGEQRPPEQVASVRTGLWFILIFDALFNSENELQITAIALATSPDRVSIEATA